jgi:hypothetical protein
VPLSVRVCEIPIDAIVNRVASFGYGVVAAPVAQQRLFPKTQASDGDVHCEHRCFNASIYGIFHVETSSGPTGPAVISLVRYFEIQRSGSAELPLAVEADSRWRANGYPEEWPLVSGPGPSRAGTRPNRQNPEICCLKRNWAAPTGTSESGPDLGLATAMSHTTAARPRKAGAVITLRISQAKQEQARHLDHMADRELAIGRHAAAERLSHEAYQLRQEAQQ